MSVRVRGDILKLVRADIPACSRLPVVNPSGCVGAWVTVLDWGYYNNIQTSMRSSDIGGRGFYVWVYGCMNAWVHGCIDAWVHACMGVGAWVHGCMSA